MCLLVYNLGQIELRKTLKRTNSEVINQLGKLTNTPTLRQIFQWFQGVDFLTINQQPKVVNLREKKTTLKLRRKLETTGFDTVTQSQNHLKSINKKLKLWEEQIFRNQVKKN